jgi:RNA polymerase sigma factor (sigma-70 family)
MGYMNFEEARLMAETQEFRVEMRIRNNRLLTLIEQSGLSKKAFAEQAGVSYSTLCQLVAMSNGPLRKDGGWRDIAIKLEKHTGVLREDIFPEAVLAVEKNRLELQWSAEDVQMLMPPALTQISAPDTHIDEEELEDQMRMVLATLTPREEKVLRESFYEDKSLDEISKDWEITRERILQVKAKALRKLRHPSRAKRLKAFVDARLVRTWHSERDWPPLPKKKPKKEEPAPRKKVFNFDAKTRAKLYDLENLAIDPRNWKKWPAKYNKPIAVPGKGDVYYDVFVEDGQAYWCVCVESTGEGLWFLNLSTVLVHFGIRGGYGRGNNARGRRVDKHENGRIHRIVESDRLLPECEECQAAATWYETESNRFVCGLCVDRVPAMKLEDRIAELSKETK